MRGDERWACTPAIMVSAHATAVPGFLRPTGLDAFVAKPFNTNVLADLVHERIERARELEGPGRALLRQLLTQDYTDARLADDNAHVLAAGTRGHALGRA